MNLQALLGNFALILFILTLATGVVWFFDVFYLSRQRRARADAALARQIKHVEKPDHAGDYHQHEQDQGEIS